MALKEKAKAVANDAGEVVVALENLRTQSPARFAGKHPQYDGAGNSLAKHFAGQLRNLVARLDAIVER